MQTITVAGGNLFRIAAEQLGDATQWVRIAQLNRLPDPMLAGLSTLLIPDPDPNAGGGIAVSSLRTPTVAVLADGQDVPGILDVDIHKNAHLAAARFRIRLALQSGEPVLDIQPGTTLDLQLSLGGPTRSVLQGEADTITIDPINRTVELDGRDLTARLLTRERRRLSPTRPPARSPPPWPPPRPGRAGASHLDPRRTLLRR